MEMSGFIAILNNTFFPGTSCAPQAIAFIFKSVGSYACQQMSLEQQAFKPHGSSYAQCFFNNSSGDPLDPQL